MFCSGDTFSRTALLSKQFVRICNNYFSPKYSDKTDVFAFAVLAWETVARQHPYQEGGSSGSGSAPAAAPANGPPQTFDISGPRRRCGLTR